MNSERKEPHLSGLDTNDDSRERIPTLTERATYNLHKFRESDPGKSPAYTDPFSESLADVLGKEPESLPRLDDYDFVEELAGMKTGAPIREASAPTTADDWKAPHRTLGPVPEIRSEDILALSDRVLDQIAPALREAITAAVTELLSRQSRDTR